QKIQLALEFHGEAVDRVLQLLRCVYIKMPEPPTNIRTAADLPEQPRQALITISSLWQKFSILFGQVEQDSAGLEQHHRRVACIIYQCRDLGVWIYLAKTR